MAVVAMSASTHGLNLGRVYFLIEFFGTRHTREKSDGEW